MAPVRIGLLFLSAFGALEVGACTFGPADNQGADSGSPASTGGVAPGGASSGDAGGAVSGGAGGVPSTGGASGGGAASGGAGGAPLDGSVPDASSDGGGVCGHCALGQYCDLVDKVCRSGCASGAMCASGSCNASHECDRCVSDTECAAGHVCSTGQCLPNCTTSADCPSKDTCCGNRCADLSRDHAHCAFCGTACSAIEYCSATTGCAPNTLATTCDTPHLTFILDGADVDDALTPAVKASLLSQCGSSIPTETDPETASPATNPTTGEPVSGGGDLIVELGSPYSQKVARYVESAGDTRVKDISDGMTFHFYGPPSSDGGPDSVIVQAPAAAFTATHDFFKIEMVVDPISGTRILQIYGIFAPGTAAGEWFFVNRMLPNLSAFPLRYYVYEWTHGDAGPLPGASDSFVLLASGN